MKYLAIIGAVIIMLLMVTFLLLSQNEEAPAMLADGSVCSEHGSYLVIERTLGDSVGTDILVAEVLEGSTRVCAYEVLPGDFEVKNEVAEYFLALEDNFLILDSGTAPEPRGLIVYDVTQEEKVFEDTYSSPVMVEDGTLRYWHTSTTEPTAAHCPQLTEWESYGLSAAMESLVELDLNTLEITELDELRCAARQ